MSDADVLREIFSPEEMGYEGWNVFVREPRADVERRARLLRRCALLLRVQLEEYERRMPLPERRTYRDLDAQVRFHWEVSGPICRLVTRITELAPGGVGKQWGEAVDLVRALSFEEAHAELMSFPLAP